MQPAAFKAFAISQENNAVKVQNTLNNRFERDLNTKHCILIRNKEKDNKYSCDITSTPFHTWITGLGDNLHQNSTSYANSPQVGYQTNTWGISSGIDYHFARYFYLGALGAYTDSHITWSDNQGKGDIETGYAGLYFSAISNLFYGNLSVIGSWSHYNAYRNINLPLRTLSTKNNHGGSQILSHLDTGINLGWKAFTLRPFDAFDYISQTEQSFTESGAQGLDLHVQKVNAIMLRNELGLSFATCFCFKGSQWEISPKISWVREVRVKGENYTAEFENSTAPFTVTGFFPDRSLVSPGINITSSMLQDLLTVTLYYNGEFKGNYSDHSYGGQLRFAF